MPAPRARLAAWTASLALSFAPAVASAEIPTGSFEFRLSGVNSLWMGGDTDTHADADGFCASFGAAFDDVDRCDYELVVDGRGRIGGHVEFIGWLDDTLIELDGPIRGAQRGSNRTGVTRAAFAIQLAGTASRGAVTLDMRVSQKLVAQIDAGGLMTGTWTQKTCIEGSACETLRFPAGPTVWSNGHWTLELDVELITFGGSEFGRRAFTFGGLAGVARIRFGDETFCDFVVSGQHDSKKEVADLTLTPTSAMCQGGSLRLRSLVKGGGALTDAYLAQLQYKLFGVAGTTVVDTQVASAYRVLLEHYDDLINQPLPPFGSSGSGNSGAMATITLQIVSGAPPQFTVSSMANSATISVSAMGVLADSGEFEALQSGARFELTGFEARPVGPERPVLGTSAELPGVDPLTQY